MKIRAAALVLTAVLVAVPTSAEDNRDLLDGGGAIIRLAEAESSGEPRLGEIRQVIDLPMGRLFRAILDCHNYREFMPYVTASDGKPVAENSIDCRQTVKTPFSRRSRTFTVRLRTQLPGRPTEGPEGVTYTASWTLAPGATHDIETSRGIWTLTEWQPGRTLVQLRLVQDFGLTTRLQDRATSSSLPWILDGLRQQANRCRYDVPRATGCRETPPILPGLRSTPPNLQP